MDAIKQYQQSQHATTTADVPESPAPHATPVPEEDISNDPETEFFDSLPTDWADQMQAVENAQRPNTPPPLVFEHHHEVPAFMTTIMDELNSLRSQVQQQDTLLHELKSITDRLTKVTEELNKANTRVLELEKENNQLREQITQPTPRGTSASIYAHDYMNANNTQQSSNTQRSATSTNPWSQPDRVKKLKQRPQPSAATIQRRKEAAARCFQPLSDNQGFQYTYFFSKVRYKTGEVRAKLRRIGVDNSRVLDIHYPDYQVVALLTHNDYVEDLKAAMAAHGALPMQNFDPRDPTRLRDPKYKDEEESKRKEIASKLHLARMIKALEYIRIPVRLAVARDFKRKEWISEDQLKDILRPFARQPSTQSQQSDAAANFRQPEPTTDNNHKSNDTEMTDANDVPQNPGSIGSQDSLRL
ncbi:hypothetical protein O0I10_013240 [Lichtheimia ornata]|uniref:Uncharacterized protein n=1 Tax=Lichtheimia ornata TaxID=688661 RepID=A0AAD7XSF1_9FUNG|nr:uncharacterized protein O0I10_013240 [Lichtheimia ornata]KAJ8651278.1 hypothetical protein O0I10_013240 [Lichtheimia ornata]